MSKRKHRHSRSKAGSSTGKPATTGTSGKSGSLTGIVIAVVVLLGVGVLIVKSWRAPESSVAGTNAPPAGTNTAVAKAPPTPAPAAPEVDAAEAGPAKTASAAPPSAKIDTNSVSDMLNLGNYLLNRNQFAEAEKAYRRAVEINPDDEDSHFNLGVALAREQQYDDAAKEYDTALKLYPDYVEAKNNLANVLIKLGRTNDAISQLEEAVQLKPDYVQGLNNLGRLRAVQGDLDKAKSLLQKAAELDPKDFEVQFNLGNVSLQKGDNAGAATYFEKAHNLKPENLLAINLLAKSLTLSGRLDQALELLKKSMADHPNSPELLYNTGLLQMGSGHPVEAVALLEKAVKLAPNYAPAQQALKQAREAAAKAATPPDLKSTNQTK